jgi:hypothetical protein
MLDFEFRFLSYRNHFANGSEFSNFKAKKKENLGFDRSRKIGFLDQVNGRRGGSKLALKSAISWSRLFYAGVICPLQELPGNGA